EIVAAAEPPILPRFPWWSVILGGTVLLLTAYVWRTGYSARTPHTRVGAVSAPPAGESEPEYSNVR
ncbi:MAG: hypothetical protein Q4G64_04300, partial [bacterium]|nr:hypothetical protein [bacterium]